MRHTTEDFTSPTGSLMLFATYNDESKVVAFEHAQGYFYTSDSATMANSMKADEFIRTHKKHADTVQEANAYLTSLGIDVQFHPVN